MRLKIESNLALFSILLIFLDAYSIFSVPISWFGQFLFFLIFFQKYIKLKLYKNKISKIFYIFLLIFLVPSINIISFQEAFFVSLRIFNIISFFTVFMVIINDNSYKKVFDNKFASLLTFLSIFSIYIFIAQIFDLYEPLRNRASTTIFEDDIQSTFWLSQPHRLMGTFREPSFYAAFLFPIFYVNLISKNKLNLIFVFVISISIGLTRSDYVRLICFVVLVGEILIYIKKKEINFKLIFSILVIFLFSNYGILECNVNPDSNDCLNYVETVEIMNLDGKFKLKSNNSTPIETLGNERLNTLNYFLKSLPTLSSNGLDQVGSNYKNFLSEKVREELYLTNRTLPNYLLIRFLGQDFGTGDFQTLFNEYNVQNQIIFYSISLGPIFIGLFITFFSFIFFNKKNDKFLIYFFIICLMIFLNPIEEVNGYFAFILASVFNQLKQKNFENETSI